MTATTASIPTRTADRWWTTALVCNYLPPVGEPIPFWVCPSRMQAVGLAPTAADALQAMRDRAARDGWTTTPAGQDVCPHHA